MQKNYSLALRSCIGLQPQKAIFRLAARLPTGDPECLDRPRRLYTCYRLLFEAASSWINVPSRRPHVQSGDGRLATAQATNDPSSNKRLSSLSVCSFPQVIALACYGHSRRCRTIMVVPSLACLISSHVPRVSD